MRPQSFERRRHLYGTWLPPHDIIAGELDAGVGGSTANALCRRVRTTLDASAVDC